MIIFCMIIIVCFNYDDQSVSALTTHNRGSRQEVFCETSAFKNFEKFRGKHRSLF